MPLREIFSNNCEDCDQRHFWAEEMRGADGTVSKSRQRGTLSLICLSHQLLETVMWLFMLFTATLAFSTSCMLTSAQTETVGDKAAQMSKVAPELIALYDEYSSYLTSHSAGPFKPADPLVRVVDSRVVVDAVASGDVNVLKLDLVSLGMQEAVAFGRMVSGQLPISAIPAMAALSSLNFARAAAGISQGG